MPKISLLPHQEQALKATENLNRVAYYLDMGLGKTFVGSEKMMSFGTKRNLIVCQKSKVGDWIDHIRTYYKDVTAVDLTVPGSISTLASWDGGSTCVGVINYDLVFRRPPLKSLTGFTLMLDESSLIQNEQSKRAKTILRMHPDNVILLSGTPTAGKYERLWSQLRLLGWGISKRLYYSQYIKMDWIEDSGGFRIPRVIGYKNVDRLKSKLAEHGAIFMKSEEAFALPEQNFIQVSTKLPKEYRKFMRDEVITIADKQYIGDTTLSKRLYARMICSHLNPARLAAFKDLVSSTEDRLIVFYNFKAELLVMADIAAELERPISIVNGDIKDLARYEDCENSVTFVQYQAGAMGLNLQKANKIIYFSPTDRSELYEQSKKRIHRIGQSKPCFYYQLICPGSVEEDILECLKMRKDYTDELFKKHQTEFA